MILHVESSISYEEKVRCNCSFTTERKWSCVREEGIQYWTFMWQGGMVNAQTRKETLEEFDDLNRHNVLL